MKKNTILTATVAIPFALLVLASTAFAAPLTRQLDFGMTNSDVTSLQTFLATDATIYPQGLVTGYFGVLTKAAVTNFQVRNGIDPVGRVGPITLAAINAQMAGGMSQSTDTTEGAGKVTNIGTLQPVLSNIAVSSTNNSATITWNSSVPAAAKVFYSTQWPFVYKTAATVSGTNGYSNNQSVTINNLSATTTYYYTVESLDAQGNFSWSTPGASFKTQ